MATILVTHGIPAEGFSLLSGEKIVIPKPLMHFSMDELAALIPAADAVVACGALPGEIIRRGTKLRIIAGYGAGYDGVDVRAAAECGIPVTNLPDTVTDSTAELAIGLMLAVSRRIGENSLRVRAEAPENLFGMGRNMGRSLRGQTLGLLGCGRIGKRTAEIAVALGMRCIGYSRHGVNHPQVEHVNHVATQLPYAITVACLSFVCFVFAGFIQNWVVCLAIGVALTVATLFVLRAAASRRETANA